MVIAWAETVSCKQTRLVYNSLMDEGKRSQVIKLSFRLANLAANLESTGFPIFILAISTSKGPILVPRSWLNCRWQSVMSTHEELWGRNLGSRMEKGLELSIRSCVSSGNLDKVQTKQMITCNSGIWIETTKAPISFKYSTADGKECSYISEVFASINS